jgi:hypothetical protein
MKLETGTILKHSLAGITYACSHWPENSPWNTFSNVLNSVACGENGCEVVKIDSWKGVFCAFIKAVKGPPPGHFWIIPIRELERLQLIPTEPNYIIFN